MTLQSVESKFYTSYCLMLEQLSATTFRSRLLNLFRKRSLVFQGNFSFLVQSRRFFQQLPLLGEVRHGQEQNLIFEGLPAATHVWILRGEEQLPSLKATFVSPYPVVKQDEEACVLTINGRYVTVSIDGLKRAYILAEGATCEDQQQPRMYAKMLCEISSTTREVYAMMSEFGLLNSSFCELEHISKSCLNYHISIRCLSSKDSSAVQMK